ncbi:MAG: NAD-dependent epimerase/dehydratase family protein, partial [Plesiomonas shigelloides]
MVELNLHRECGMRKCLVMGAAGYIGSYLVPHLQAQGYQVVAGARR